MQRPAVRARDSCAAHRALRDSPHGSRPAHLSGAAAPAPRPPWSRAAHLAGTQRLSGHHVTETSARAVVGRVCAPSSPPRTLEEGTRRALKPRNTSRRLAVDLFVPQSPVRWIAKPPPPRRARGCGVATIPGGGG